MNEFFRRLRGQQRHKYAPVRQAQDDGEFSRFQEGSKSRSANIWTRKHIGLLIMVGILGTAVGLLGIGYVLSLSGNMAIHYLLSYR